MRGQVCEQFAMTGDILDGYWRPFCPPADKRAMVEIARCIIAGCFFDEYLLLVDQPTLVVAGSEAAHGGSGGARCTGLPHRGVQRPVTREARAPHIRLMGVSAQG